MANLEPIRTSGDGGKRRPADNALYDATKRTTARFMVGRLKQCEHFLQKNLRDLPLIGANTGQHPTVTQKAAICQESAVILSGASILADLLANNLQGTVSHAQFAGDRLGVGARYAGWIDPIVDHLQ